MKVPFNWINEYIKIKGTFEDFGAILTSLEFMQDGPIKEIEGQKVIDIEVRQNRPDVLSILGVAREYSAYINVPIIEPKKFDIKQSDIKWEKPDTILKVDDKDNVKRFCAVKINKVKITNSPNWMKNNLESYGIPSINNVVDITNYVMVEYGIPMHAFDISKLAEKENHSLLLLRKADQGEEFETWQGTKIKLTSQDTVVADAEKPVAIAGIIGGANSDIDKDTKSIILEAACYNQAATRRTSIRHNIRTEASSRHEKFLNPELVKDAILRAIYLLQEFASAEIEKIEDYYEKSESQTEMEFNINEIARLSGVTIEAEEASSLLIRLGFDVIEHKEAIGVDKNILTVRVPKWRTDILTEADLVEEVLRLWGYENIPFTPLQSRVPDFGTPHDLLLEDFLKDQLVALGLYEQVLSPFVRKDAENDKQIVLENALNSENEALRTSIRESLIPVTKYYIKAGKKNFGIFESAKIYLKVKEGEYTEEKRIESIYINCDFKTRVKPDFLNILNKLGVNGSNLTWKKEQGMLKYQYNGKTIAELYSDGYQFYLAEINEIVNVYDLPKLNIKTSITQQIVEDLTLLVPSKEMLGKISQTMKDISDYVKDVEVKNIFEDSSNNNKRSITFSVLLEDVNKKLTRENVEEIKEKILNELKKIKVELKSKPN